MGMIPCIVEPTVAVECPTGYLRSFSLTGKTSVDPQSLSSYSVEQCDWCFTSTVIFYVGNACLLPFMWFLSPLFIEGLLKKPSSSSDPLADLSTAVMSHAAVNSDARSTQIFSRNQNLEIQDVGRTP